jgi:hypothetical protein
MPAHFYERRPQEAAITSPRLQAVITDLAAYYEVDLTQAGARFTVARPEQSLHWVIANLDGRQLDVARCPVEDALMVPDIDLVFAIAPHDWQLVSTVHSDGVWEAYVKVATAQGQVPGDPQTQFPFRAFAEYAANLIEVEGRQVQVNDAEAVKARISLE